jgi:hypothetical protein
MRIVAILRVIWRRRALVAIGAAAAVGVSVAIGPTAPTRSAIGWTTVVVDTRPSQLVDAAPPGAETLSWRAALIADLVTADPVRTRIAAAAGVPAGQLRVIEPTLEAPPAPTALPRRAARAAGETTEPYVVHVTADDELVTIDVRAQAPDRRTAGRLVRATAAALSSFAPPAGVRGLQPFDLRPTGAVQTAPVVDGGGRLFAFVLAAALFAIWCAGVGFAPALRGGRLSARREPARRPAA